MNYGVCEKCRARVPVEHVIRDGQVYLARTCPTCGYSEAVVSNDADAWQAKRRLARFDPARVPACSLTCDTCFAHGSPRMVFLDVTNRCNMNCPICVANVPSMRFEFYPPRQYFERIFKGLSQWEPKPVVHFFGGEPTCRDDLFELIDLGRSFGLTIFVVTNGLKLADEDYCRRLCEKDVPILLGFDGRAPEIYAGMRKNTSVAAKKIQALENMRRFSKRRQNIIMCCCARGINDRHMADTIAFCHEHRSHLKGLYLLPLTETWDNDRYETTAVTTIEDVEQMVDAALDEPVEFLPLGMQNEFTGILSSVGAGHRETFQSVHPNCESATLLISDGERYRPVSHFLKRPLAEAARDALDVAETLGERPGRLRALRAMNGWWHRSCDTRRVMQGSPKLALLRLFTGLLAGKPLADQLRAHTHLRDPLRVIVLPFEETHSLESARLVRCASGFAYEDVDTGEVRSIPACSWWLYNVPILKAIQAKYDALAAEAPSGEQS
ncbi:MAG: radical SAM protein [Candidatus Brocadiaceae bacterium]|nr:radical SAM protein [Candidatus Brocadiaceae bacterium]